MSYCKNDINVQQWQIILAIYIIIILVDDVLGREGIGRRMREMRRRKKRKGEKKKKI